MGVIVRQKRLAVSLGFGAKYFAQSRQNGSGCCKPARTPIASGERAFMKRGAKEDLTVILLITSHHLLSRFVNVQLIGDFPHCGIRALGQTA